MSEILVDSVIPFLTVAKPAAIRSAPVVPAVDVGVNSSADTTYTTESPVTPFKICFSTFKVEVIVSGTMAVTPDPATDVGPINVKDVPL